MHLSRLFLVHLSTASRPVVLAAAREAFPEADAVEVDTVAETGSGGGAGQPELLVLAEPDAIAAAAAVQALDANGLPRWAVVILGRDFADLAETVPPEEWNPPLLARVFRSAVLQHQLLYENLRLQGDLRTVARRVSHDLYTPVGCIYTSAHVLELLGSNDAGSIAAMIENIKESSKEISALIERICGVLRASADPSTAERVEMHEVVAAVLKQLEPAIQRTGATVTQPASWPEVAGVAPWLQVIWWNLLDNAMKHGGPSAEIRLAWSRTPDGCRFSVVDRGAGIAPALQAGLFQPFDQLHTLRTPGLGLSIVQRLVALQGGRCGYERLADGTSAFFFTLPAGPVRAGREGPGSDLALPAVPADESRARAGRG
jgi:signal transduction histidine kinase